MPYPERLDPREVLAHLHQLGYHNITAHQLKEFIIDLKKLIKHEQRLKEDADKENITHLNDSNFTTHSHSSKDPCKKMEQKTIYLDNESDSSSDTTDISDSSSTITECSCLTDGTHVKRFPCYSSQDSKSTKLQRPQSSFIRPWRLHPSHKTFSGNPMQKTDPVKLYHKYKEIWAQQKVPGENDHSQLRWTIREKMLGTDPHPRPMSQASSEGRRRVNRL